MLIVALLVMVCIAILIIAFLKLATCLIELIWGVAKLLWAVGSLMDRLFTHAVREVEEEEGQSASPPPQPGLRLVSSYGRRIGT